MSGMPPEGVPASLIRASTLPAVIGFCLSCGAASARPPRNSPPKRLIYWSIFAFDSKCLAYKSDWFSSPTIFLTSSSPKLFRCSLEVSEFAEALPATDSDSRGAVRPQSQGQRVANVTVENLDAETSASALNCPVELSLA